MGEINRDDHPDLIPKSGSGLEDGLGALGLLGWGWSYDLKCRDQNVG